MPVVHVVTGATGLLGSALVLELAGRTDDAMVCLVRSPDPEKATDTLRTALERSAHAFGYPPDTADAVLRRTRVARFDLLSDQPCELPRLPPGSHPQVWHSAAHTGLHERDRRRCFAANVGGTRRLLALARRLEAQSFTHLSTAQVAGRNQGVIEEEPVTEASPRNGYEASKIAAERLVTQSTDLRVRVLRPSAVIGHSTTYDYPGRVSGVFTLQRTFAAFARSEELTGADEPLRIVATADQPFHLVPVDQVVREAVAIGAAPEAFGVFHLTHPCAPSIGTVLEAVVVNAGARPPVFVDSPAQLSGRDRRLHRHLKLFDGYLNNSQDLQRHRTRQMLPTSDGDGAVPADVSVEALRSHLRTWTHRRTGAL